MKIKCKRASFLDAMQISAMAVSKDEEDTTLRQAKIKVVGEDTLEMVATNLEIGVRYTISGVEVLSSGEMVIPADRIQGILKESKEDVFELEQTAGGCILRSEGSTFKMVTHSAEEFPEMPNTVSESVTLRSHELKEMIHRVIFSAAKESDSRYALKGVLFDLRQGRLSLVSTDGKRLSLAKKIVYVRGEECKGLVPSNGLKVLDKILTLEKGDMIFGMDENHIVFCTAKCILYCKLIEGRFPKFEDIIPSKRDFKALECFPKTLLSKIRQSAIFANPKSKMIRFKIDNRSINILSVMPSVGEADVLLPCEHQEGLEPVTFGFNPDYLVDLLKIWWKESFRIFFKDEDSPILIEDEDDFLYLVMPIELSD